MVGLGALGGALSALFTEGIKLFRGSQDRKHELKLLEMQRQVGETESERETAIVEMKSITEQVVNAREHDMAIQGTSQWVTDTRGITRPFLTFYAVIVATTFFFTGDQVIKEQVVASFMLLMEAIISFWFTGRMLKK